MAHLRLADNSAQVRCWVARQRRIAIAGAVIGAAVFALDSVGHADTQLPTPAPTQQAPLAVPLPVPSVGGASVWQQLGWPVTTKSAALDRAAHVYDGATTPAGPKIIGKLAAGTRVAVTAIVDTPAVLPNKKTCPRWAEIAPRGVICATSLQPSDAPPIALHLPVVAPGDVVPGEYFVVDDAGVDLYKTRADAQAGQPTGELAGRVMIRNLETVWLDSLAYYRVDKGYVPMSGVRALHPSDFAGVAITGAVRLPITWVVASAERNRHVLDAPKKRGAQKRSERAKARSGVLIRSVERYQQVVVRASQQDFVDIGDDRHGSEWLPRNAIATAAISTRPQGVTDAALWIDIDLSQQTLVLYRGDTPLFATLVSTGKKNHATPTGEFTIYAKAAVTAMTSEAGERAQYDVSAVPWAMRFTKGIYLHAAYWHDGFGTKRSHGCVNLSPRDAHWLYDRLPPAVPDGWSELEISDGPVVRIR